jgi:cellulose synthase/poly-beta-1,6-N-acetylglucosamine synthase-like glycosyltransferase
MNCAPGIFWVTTLFLVYTYLGYPLWIWIRSQLWPCPWIRKEIYPSVSVIMPVHNGGVLLTDKVKHLLTLDYPRELLELIIISDGSDDRTNQTLSAISDSRVRTFLLPERVGKASALNVGMRQAKGELLVFVDLRPVLEAGALRRLASNFADPQIGCVTGEVVLRSHDQDVPSAAVGGLYWRYEQWIRKCEAQSGSIVGVYGGFYAARRELVSEFPDGTILDDMYQPVHVIRQGYRAVLDQGARVWDMWPKTAGGEFARKVRTLAGNFQLLRLAPWLLSQRNSVCGRFVSHKLLRLLAPAPLVLLLMTSWLLRANDFYAAVFLAQAAFYGTALVGFTLNNPITRRISGPATAFCLLNAAAVVALWKFLLTRGPLWKLWGQPQLAQTQILLDPPIGRSNRQVVAGPQE